jgi:hypothetical protein
VGVVLDVYVEFPFLDLAPGADVDSGVEGGEFRGDGCAEGGVGVAAGGPAAEDVGEEVPD